MICLFCKCEIDDDSFYCDQCGQEILICPKCNKPSKGKFCTSDGTTLVKMKEKMAPTPLSNGITVGVSTPSPNLESGGASGKSELHLINRTLGLDIKVEKDVSIGRTKGDFVDIFAKYDTVSSEHLKITYDPQKGWLATDLGSTNGTKYNNTPLIPNQQQLLSDKSYLQIANIEFFVEIKNQPEKLEQ